MSDKNPNSIPLLLCDPPVLQFSHVGEQYQSLQIVAKVK